MQALNCFGTCHKNWWNSFSLQSTFSSILLSLPQCPVFPAFYLLSLFLPELLSIVSRKQYQLVFEQSTYLNFLLFFCIDTLEKCPKRKTVVYYYYYCNILFNLLNNENCFLLEFNTEDWKKQKGSITATGRKNDRLSWHKFNRRINKTLASCSLSYRLC